MLFLPALRIQIWPQAGRGWAGKGASISSQSENLATNFRGRGGERRKEWFMDIYGIRFGDKIEGKEERSEGEKGSEKSQSHQSHV